MVAFAMGGMLGPGEFPADNLADPHPVGKRNGGEDFGHELQGRIEIGRQTFQMEPEDRAGGIRNVPLGVGGKGMGKGPGAGGYFFRELLIAESLRADFGDDGAEQVEQRQEFRRQTGIIEAD
ncbi:MAG: hypothetical protein ACD_75C01613G0001, partial [uncultured bacterium]